MANLNEADDWPAGIYQIEEDDPVLGGPTGIANVPPTQLAARSRYQRVRNVTPWAEAIPYPAAAFVAHNGATWKSIAPSIGVQPGSDGTKWTRWGYTAQELADALSALKTAHEAEDDPHPVYLLRVAAALALALKAPLESPALTGNPTAPTAAQFDNDTSIANTAFVQRALGNYRGTVVITAATNLTAADAGKVLSVNIGGFAITLPAGATLAAGACFLVLSTVPCTVQRNGTDLIYTGNGNSTITGIALGPGDSAFLVWNGGSWVLQGGSVQLAYANIFRAVIGINGHHKLPNGIIEQWGNVITNASGVAAITYPIAFPNVVVGGSLTVAASGTHYSASFDADLGLSTAGTSIRLNAAASQKVYFRMLGY